MQQPPGFEEENSEHLLCHLKKALYGQKQAIGAWNLKFDECLQGAGFESCCRNLVCTSEEREAPQ